MARKLTPTDIKRMLCPTSSFFDRGTMQMFGDTMKSFNTIVIGGVTYLYRKPSATIKNFYGQYVQAGRKYFNVWRFDVEDKRLASLSDDEEEKIYNLI